MHTQSTHTHTYREPTVVGRVDVFVVSVPLYGHTHTCTHTPHTHTLTVNLLLLVGLMYLFLSPLYGHTHTCTHTPHTHTLTVNLLLLVGLMYLLFLSHCMVTRIHAHTLHTHTHLPWTYCCWPGWCICCCGPTVWLHAYMHTPPTHMHTYVHTASTHTHTYREPAIVGRVDVFVVPVPLYGRGWVSRRYAVQGDRVTLVRGRVLRLHLELWLHCKNINFNSVKNVFQKNLGILVLFMEALNFSWHLTCCFSNSIPLCASPFWQPGGRLVPFLIYFSSRSKRPTQH